MRNNIPNPPAPEQLRLIAQPSANGASGTFSPNRTRPFHRWYPYLEGFSEEFVLALLDEFGRSARVIHDPFAGTGTTAVVASMTGRDATYCEVNPFMRLVVESKTSGLREAQALAASLPAYLSELVVSAEAGLPSVESARSQCSEVFGTRKYFEDARLRELVALQRAIANTEPPCGSARSLALVALGSIVVGSSELIRAGDVRYRKGREFSKRIASPIDAFRQSVLSMITDVELSVATNVGRVALLTDSALTSPERLASVDMVITSPPYLNGTNYFRNTKLELWITGFLEAESDLRGFRTAAVAAGINNVSKVGRKPRSLNYVEDVASRLDEVAYDRRIPELVRRYFSDAYLWLGNLEALLSTGGRALVDIGDSRFSGVHVPTDELLAKVGRDVGLAVQETRLLRHRRSNDGTPLRQTLIVFQKP